MSSERISFNLLRQKDGSRVKQQYVAVNDGKPVERSEMVKGYEFAKDQYVMFSPEELKALEDTTSHSIDIGQFVPLESVDPVYFDGTYYLAPDKGRRQALHAAVHRPAQGRSMCCRQMDIARQGTHRRHQTDRGRPRPASAALQSRGARAERFGGSKPRRSSEPELKLAQQLIDHLAVKRFDPNEYLDEHRARVQAAIQKKVEGKEVSLAEGPVAAKGSNVIDLMEALRASIDARPTKAASPAASLKERKAPKRAAPSTSSRKTARR